MLIIKQYGAIKVKTTSKSKVSITKKTTAKTEKTLLKSINKQEMDKKIFENLKKKHPISIISEISSELINVFKHALINKLDCKIPGLFSSQIKHVKARQFVSINTPRKEGVKPVKTESKPRLRAIIKVSKEIQKVLNGQSDKKAVVSKKPEIKPTTVKKPK